MKKVRGGVLQKQGNCRKARFSTFSRRKRKRTREGEKKRKVNEEPTDKTIGGKKKWKKKK